MLAAVNILFLILIAFWVWKRDNNALRKFYWPALIVKCLAGISLGIIYSTYYDTSDTFIFFKLATSRADLAHTDFSSYLKYLFSAQDGYFLGEHRTVFYTKITSVFAWITGNNYWITSLHYSMLSFFAAWYIANTTARIFPAYRIAACIAFLFFPSVVFWSSGIIKESLAMAALFFLVAVFLKLWVRERISVIQIVLSILCVIIVFNLKYYYLAVFLPVALASRVVHFISNRYKIEHAAKQFLIFAGVLIAGFMLVTFIHPNFSPAKLLHVIVLNNHVFMKVCAPDDVIHFYNLQPTWSSMLINSPWAFISAMFRPFIWEANTLFKFINSLENLVLLMVTAMSLRYGKNIIHSPHRILILATILYCTLLSIFLALSTPNFGTLTRYAVGFLPFVVLLVFNQPVVSKLLSRFF